MANENITTAQGAQEKDLSQSEIAHSIIESLLDHTRVVSDLIAVMAQALDEDTQKALTRTKQWEAYLESRRHLEHTRQDIERFVDLVAPPAKD
jgi:hypothetical protein